MGDSIVGRLRYLAIAGLAVSLGLPVAGAQADSASSGLTPWQQQIAAADSAAAKTSDGMKASDGIPAPDTRLRRVGLSITRLFTQFEIYDTESDRAQLSYSYRSYGFKTGFGFRWNDDWFGTVYAGYSHDRDNVTAPNAIRTTYDTASFGGNLRYRLARGLFFGGNLGVQPFWGRFSAAGGSGTRNGYSLTGGPFLSYTATFGNFFATAAPALSFSYTSTGSSGVRGNQGGRASFALGLSGGWRLRNELTLGLSVTPSWVLAERSGVSSRANGPFNLALGAFGRVRVTGPLWLYGAYGFRFHRGSRSSQYGVLGLSWRLGP